MKSLSLTAALVLIPGGIAAHASPIITTEYGIEFVTVGDPGNRGVLPEETGSGPLLYGVNGSVDYEFRIGRTEVTVGQWMEFVDAYTPFVDRPIFFGQHGFYSWGATYDFANRQIVQRVPDDHPALVSFGFAARYANWLHNDKVNEAWAFETGAYDTASWQVGPNGEPPENPNYSASPDARFRLPTQDEWIKTVYWDPNRNGEGEGGYWAYPYQSDAPLVPGELSDVGVNEQLPGPSYIEHLPVGSFPQAEGVWGALDVSGSALEYVQRVNRMDSLALAGSARGGSADADQIGFSFITHAGPTSQGEYTYQPFGFRLVTSIPTPSALVVGIFSVAAFPSRRRK